MKVEKIDAAPGPEIKSAAAPTVVSGIALPKAAPANAKQKPASKDDGVASSKTGKSAAQRQGFKLSEFVVYPAHGVGQIVAIEEQEVAGFKLELFVISFSKDKMTLRVPTSKVSGVGMRKISDPDTAKRSLDILSGRARVKRTMWSRRAQEYETKINSGDIAAIAEVVRDLYRSEAQPEQSYSERQLYEAALDRMVREIAAVQKSNEIDALKAIEAQLQKTAARQAKAGAPQGCGGRDRRGGVVSIGTSQKSAPARKLRRAFVCPRAKELRRTRSPRPSATGRGGRSVLLESRPRPSSGRLRGHPRVFARGQALPPEGEGDALPAGRLKGRPSFDGLRQGEGKWAHHPRDGPAGPAAFPSTGQPCQAATVFRAEKP